MPTTGNSFLSPQTIREVNAVTVAAKTTYNDAVNAVKLFDAHPTNGSILFGLTATPRATVTATQLQIYVSPDNGTTMYLTPSPLMAAYTMAQTTQVPSTDSGYAETKPRRVKAGSSVWVGQGVALAGGISWDGQVEDL